MFLLRFGLWGSPSLINAAHALLEHGYAVDIYADSQQPDEFVGADARDIRVFVLGKPSAFLPGGKVSTFVLADDSNGADTAARLRLRAPGRIARYLEPWLVAARKLWDGAALSVQIVRKVRTNGPYCCLIGAEIPGLAVASMLGAVMRVPTVFWSLELLLWRDARSPWQRLLKVAELIGYRRAAFVIIQDRERAACLAAETRFSRADVILVPATARGPVRRERSRYLREYFPIADHQKILLHAGSLRSWALCLELAEAAQSWPDDLVLVLHGFGPPDYLERIRVVCTVPGRVHLSLDLLPYAQLDDLIASADIGLALYRGAHMNHQLLGAASGKSNEYLKCGVPVISSDFPTLKRSIEGTGCGLCVGSASEVSAAARTILDRYDAYSRAAATQFEQHRDFDRYFQGVLNRLDPMCGVNQRAP